METQQQTVRFRLIHESDISDIIQLQWKTFPVMSQKGEIWEEDEIKKYLRIFPEGQFCAEVNGKIVGSASSLIVNMRPEYRNHSWDEICYNNIEKSHDVFGNSLYDVDVSVLSEFRRIGIASKLFDLRKNLAVSLNLDRIIGGGRLANYNKFCNSMSAEEYFENVKLGKIEEPAINCQIRNGFNLIKLLPNYINDDESLNFAAFIEWKNRKKETRRDVIKRIR